MKDEIKEILDKLNNKSEHYILYDYEVKVLLDYITNLEQENENLHIKLEDKANEQIKTMYLEYKSRIDKANWWLKEMLKQAKSEETKAIINGTLELLLNGGDEE